MKLFLCCLVCQLAADLFFLLDLFFGEVGGKVFGLEDLADFDFAFAAGAAHRPSTLRLSQESLASSMPSCKEPLSILISFRHWFSARMKECSPAHKYARVERERRFLLEHFPVGLRVARIRRIEDHYIRETNLRLRKQDDDEGPSMFKLTQKISMRGSGAQQGLNLPESEFRVLTQLPSDKLSKTRHSVSPYGIDVFQGHLEGLVLAEAEFDSAVDAENLMIASFVLHEVSSDERFTGGRLVRASREDLRRWPLEYGITLK